MKDCNAVHVPMDPSLKLSKAQDEKSVDEKEYRRSIAGLRYLLHTRVDLSFSFEVMSIYMQDPKTSHAAAMKQILRYLQGTLAYGLVFRRAKKTKLRYSDASHNVDEDDGRSTTGHVFISWIHLLLGVLRKKKLLLYLLVKQSLWRKQMQLNKPFGFKIFLVK